MFKPAMAGIAGTLTNNLRIVLVETSHSGNIGAVARAMKNMGLQQLYLVRPNSFPDEVSYARSSGATDILDYARVVDSLEEAIGDATLVFGTSARGRKVPWPVMPPAEATAKAVEAAATAPVALVFGRENSGLTNDELQRCHYHIHIPSNPDYSSLNLAMAVQVIAYEVRMRFLEAQDLETHEKQSGMLDSLTGPGDPGWDVAAATVNEVEGLFEHLERTLERIEFHRRDNPRQLMTRLRRLFQRARLDQMEVNILRGVLSAVEKSAGGTIEQASDAEKKPQDQDNV